MDPGGYRSAKWAKRFTENVCSTASPKSTEERISTKEGFIRLKRGAGRMPSPGEASKLGGAKKTPSIAGRRF
jgi:hypothetical protein